MPFIACGDLSGYDADANYDLPTVGEGAAKYAPIEPTQKPTTPAYRAYIESQKGKNGRNSVLDAQWQGGAEPLPVPAASSSTMDVTDA